MFLVPSITAPPELRVYQDVQDASRCYVHRITPAMIDCRWLPVAGENHGVLQGEARFGPGLEELERIRRHMPVGHTLMPLPLPSATVHAIINGTGHAQRALVLGRTSGMGEQHMIFAEELPFTPRSIRLAAALPITARLSHPSIVSRAALSTVAMGRQVLDAIMSQQQPAEDECFLGELLLQVVKRLMQRNVLRITIAGQFSTSQYEELALLARLEAAHRLHKVLFGKFPFTAPLRQLEITGEPKPLELGFQWRLGQRLKLELLSILDDAPSRPKATRKRPAFSGTMHLSLSPDFPWPQYFYVKVCGDTQSPATVDRQRRPPAFEATLTAESPVAAWRNAPRKASFWAVGGHRRRGEVRLPPPAVADGRVVFGPAAEA